MAQTIYCDFEGCRDPDAPAPMVAAWLVQRTDGTVAMALCDPHYLAMCQAIVASAEESMANAPTPAAAEPEPGPDDPTDSDEPAIAAQASEELDGSEASAESEPSPRVVRRGTSPSRRAYESRRRSKASSSAARATAELAFDQPPE